MRLLTAAIVCGGSVAGVSAEPLDPVVDPTAAAASTEAEDGGSYRIGAGDVLAVDVYGEPQLSRRLPVRPDGYISLPLAEDVRAAGLRPTELAARVRERLRTYLADPFVTVEVVRAVGELSEQVRVIGAAATPRSIPFRTGMRTLDLLTATGGLTPVADGNAAVLLRDDPEAPQQIPLRLGDLSAGDLSADLATAPGDIVVVPQGFFTGDWQRRLSLSVGSGFTDNYDLDPAGRERPAIVTAVTPSLEIAGKGARFEGAMAASLSGEYVALSDSGARLLPSLLAVSSAELKRDTVFVDAAAVVSQVQLDAAAPAASAVNQSADSTLVQTYQVSPYLVSRLRDIAYVETRYALSGTVAGDSGNRSGENGTDSGSTLADSVTNAAQMRFFSPPERHSLLQWQGLLYGSRTLRFDAPDVDAAGFSATPEFGVDPRLSLLAQTGWGMLDTGDTRLSGPEIAAGFAYHPSPALNVRALGGWRLEYPQAQVTLQYAPGPATQFAAAYTDSVGFGQATLLRAVGELDYDPRTHRFVRQQSSLPYETSLEGLDIDNALTQTRQGTVSLEQRLGGTQLRLAAYVAAQRGIDEDRSSTQGGGGADQTTYGFSLALERPIDRRTVLSGGMAFEVTDQEQEQDTGAQASSGKFEDVSFGLRLTRELTKELSGWVGYQIQHRFAGSSDDEFTENAVLVGLTHRF